MLCAVQTGKLFLSGNPQSNGFLDNDKSNQHSTHAPCGHRQNASQLNCKLSPLSCSKKAIFSGKETHAQGTKGTAQTMDADRPYRVVNFENLINKFNSEYHYKSGQYADNSRRPGIHSAAARSNGNQACQRAVQRHRYIRLFIFNPGNQHNHYSRSRRRNISGHKYIGYI